MPELDTNGRQLLQVVLNDPDNVDARLVFSDWLMDHGDPRGEFIQLQCALNRPLVGAGAKTWHRPLFDGDPAALVKRERALIKKHEKEWLLPMRPFIRTWRWSRGFVDHVVADCTKFLDGADVIFAHTPLVDVELTAMKRPMLQALTNQPTTARLRALDVNFQKLDASALASFDSPSWNGLQKLNLSGNRYGVDGAAALSKLRSLTSLNTLVLNDAHFTDEMLEVLVTAPFFSQLTELDLGWNEGVTGRGALLVAKTGTSLTKISLRSTGMTGPEFRAFADAAPQLAEDVKPYFDVQ